MFFKRLLLATGNRHKYGEFLELLPRSTIEELVFAPDLALKEGVSLSVDETGTTYAMNAFLKAQAWAEAYGLPALADDSGIEAEALSWRPGVHSARIVPGSDADRRRWILSQLEGWADRRVHFVAAVALAIPGEWTLVCEGECSGYLCESEKGSGGFGYDALFLPDGCDMTFGELSSAVKNSISHRARAVKELLNILSEIP